MKIAVIGATGAVGREILLELEEVPFLSSQDIIPLASPRSHGTKVPFRGQFLTVYRYELERLKGCDAVLMSAGSAFSKTHAKDIAATGCLVIDNSSAWRLNPDIPLIIPEVNPEDLPKNFKGRIIANPNCVVIPAAVAIKPVEDAVGVHLIVASSYQAVSGAGQKGIEELSSQVKQHLTLETSRPGIFPVPIAFNLIPGIGPIGEDGFCEEETKIVEELRKIFHRGQDLTIHPTTVRVPLFNVHTVSLTLGLNKPLSHAELCALWENRPELNFNPSSDLKELPTPRLVNGCRQVFLTRPRIGFGESRSLWAQCVAMGDNLKKGAATNAVQIFQACFASQGNSR